MNNGKNVDSKELFHKLQDIGNVVQEAVTFCQGDSKSLLALLRELERLHREIRDVNFVPALPDNRQGLYSLLKDIEAEGGWPYIERMRLQAFLKNLLDETDQSDGC
jgi:hypothetical protein